MAEVAPITHNLWRAARREVFASLYNPFVLALASRRLSVESFQHYIAQDSYFLSTFNESYRLAAEAISNDNESKAILLKQRAAVEKELKLHSSLAKSWNIELKNYSKPSEATVAYTSFLEKTAAGVNSSLINESPEFLSVEIIAAMLPCMRLYAFIGQRVQKASNYFVDAKEHLFKDWISAYSSDEFEGSAKELEDLLDKQTLSLSKERKERLSYLYNEAMVLEYRFFAAQPMPKFLSKSLIDRLLEERSDGCPVSFSFDFDLTCTVVDSCAAIAELGFQSSEPTGPSRVVKESSWKSLIDLYSHGYNELAEKHLTRGQRPSTLLPQFMKDLAVFEEEANLRVQTSKILSGITRPALKEAGRKAGWQTGCSRVLRMLNSLNVELSLVSVNWSRSFVEGSLTSQGVEGVEIYCNELEFDLKGESTGNIKSAVQSALDKERVVHTFSQSQRAKWTLYVGDSLTDLLALLEADIGIAVGEAEKLKAVCALFGIQVVNLEVAAMALFPAEGHESTHVLRSRLSPGVIYTASGWDEIEAFLFGIKC